MSKTTTSITSKIKSKEKTTPKRATIKKSTAIAVPKRPRRKSAEPPESEIRQAAMKAARYALEKKATDIHILDLTAITSMTDYFVIATGSSDRQIKAIAENVVKEMRNTEGVTAWRSEGWDSLQWIIIDFVDFVVHVFQEESRKFYNMERLWADAPMTEFKEEVPKAKTIRKKKITKESAAEDNDSAPTVKVVSNFKRVVRRTGQSDVISNK